MHDEDEDIGKHAADSWAEKKQVWRRTDRGDVWNSGQEQVMTEELLESKNISKPESKKCHRQEELQKGMFYVFDQK